MSIGRCVVLVCLVVLVAFSVFHRVLYSEPYVVFDSKRMQDAYRKQDVAWNPDQGTLRRCRKRTGGTTCKTVTYKHPFYHTNHRQSATLSNDKPTTSRVLQINGIRCPRFARFDTVPTQTDCKRTLRAYDIAFPVVVKPTNGQKGHGVHLNVRTPRDVVSIIRTLQSQGRKRVIVEEQVYGADYRVFVYNGRVFDILKRELASVEGDGTHTLAQLIARRNQRQQNRKLFPTHNVNWNYLQKQLPREPVARLPELVLPRGKTVTITNIGNFHNGCNVHRVPLMSVPASTKAYFVKVNRVMGMNMSGIDYMVVGDIRSTPVAKGWVIEVNGGPDLNLHQVAQPRDSTVTGRFVKGLFE